MKRARRNHTVRTAIIGVALFGVVVFGLTFLRSGGKAKAKPKAKATTTTAVKTTTTAKTAATTKPQAAITQAQLDAITCNDRKPSATKPKRYDKPPKMSISQNKKYQATIETSCGTIVAELDAKAAPKTVNNFVFLARDSFFDGLTWHRVVKDFVIQGGDPSGSGSGGPGYSFADENIPNNGYPMGSLAMANSGPNTNGSQFFIVTGTSQLGPSYSLFGHVVKGLDVAKKLESFSPGDGPPNRPLYMFKVSIVESAG